MDDEQIIREHWASGANGERRARAMLQRDVRSLTKRRAVIECGRPVPNAEYVTVGYSARQGGCLGGLRRCGNAWLCPECAAKIAARRTSELEQAVGVWSGARREIVMLTLTLRHRADDPLETLMSALTSGWRVATRGSAHKRLKAAVGVTGHVRALEVLHGRNGWHPHVHVLLFIEGRMDEFVDWHEGRRGAAERLSRKDLVDRLAKRMFHDWAEAAKRVGLSAPIAHRGGLDWRVIGSVDELPGYLTKQGAMPGVERLAVEVTQSAGKKGRRGGRNQWELLAEAARLRRVVFAQHHGDEEDARQWLFELRSLAGNGPRPGLWPKEAGAIHRTLSRDERRLVKAIALWREFEESIKGKAALRWSNNLRAAVADLDDAFADQEMTDDEIIADVPTDVVTLAMIPTEEYEALHATMPDVLVDVRTAAGLGNPWAAQRAVLWTCRAHGITVIPVPLPDPPDDDVFELPEYVEPEHVVAPTPTGYDQWHHAIYE